MPDEAVEGQSRSGSTMMHVEVVYALPERAWTVMLELPQGATALEALAKSEIAILVPDFDPAQLGYAIFGKPINASTVLRGGDRLELLRPLIADPKQARRNRARVTR